MSVMIFLLSTVVLLVGKDSQSAESTASFYCPSPPALPISPVVGADDIGVGKEGANKIINITDVMARANRFSMFILFLQETGVEEVFQRWECKEGITIFAPTDSAFLLNSDGDGDGEGQEVDHTVVAFQALAAVEKILVLEFHALNSFYPLGTLRVFKNPITPTVATLDPRGGSGGGAGRFTLDVTSMDGTVVISDGRIHAPVSATILEYNPVAIFAIDKMLMPARFPPPLPPPVSFPVIVSNSQQPFTPSTLSFPNTNNSSRSSSPSSPSSSSFPMLSLGLLLIPLASLF